MRALFFVIALAAQNGDLGPQSAQAVLTCAYNVSNWEAKNNISSRSLLTALEKPLNAWGSDKAIVFKAGSCETCSGFQGVGVIAPNGPFAVVYTDITRKKSDKYSDYIDAKIEGTGVNDFFVNFQDGIKISQNRAAGIGTDGAVVVWPQGPQESSLPLKSINISGAGEAYEMFSRASALLKKQIDSIESQIKTGAQREDFHKNGMAGCE